MSSLVPNGSKKGINSQDSKAGIEVTLQHTVPEQDVSHQDEETLEILQGDLISFYVLWSCFYFDSFF